MRFLHTSDWHLGRRFGDHQLLGDQSLFCDWLVDLVRAEGVELVAVSGDLFDRSVPPAEAVPLLWDTFARFRDAGAVVAAITGNHDSASRLGATDRVTGSGGVYLRGGYGRAGDVTELTFADGPLALVTTPFLDPHLAPAELVEQLRAEGGGLTHEGVLGEALGRARSSLVPGTRSIVLSHAFVTGAARSDSERDLAVGEAAMVSSAVYEGFDYVALGHLHSAQRVGGAEAVRYSGAPLRYSFSETADKAVVLVDMDRRGRVAATEIPVGVGRGVATVRGTLADLAEREGNAADWVRAELTDTVRPTDAARILRANHPRLVEVEWVGGRERTGRGLRGQQAREASAEELVAGFWKDTLGEEPSPEVLARILSAFHGDPVDDQVAA